MNQLARKIKALVIDDNLANRQLATALLQIYDIQCVDAPDGETGLEAMNSGRFDLVLLDISMPGIDGNEVCKRVRNTPELRETYLVAYTAHAFASEIRSMVNAGFDSVLIKPIGVESLNKAIAPVLLLAGQLDH